MNRRGEIRVPFRCPRGCTLGAYMLVPGLPYVLATATVRARPGRPAALLFPTDARDRRRLRGIGPTKVRIDATSYEPDRQREYHLRLRLRR